MIVVLWIYLNHQTNVTAHPVTDYCREVGSLILSAKDHIKVAMYLMRYDEREGCPQDLVRYLVEVNKRGVPVYVYLYGDNYNRDAIEFLRENGISVKVFSKFLHAKVVDVDNCTVVGSHNWTWRAMHNNIEASIIVCNRPVADWLFELLEKAPQSWIAGEYKHGS